MGGVYHGGMTRKPALQTQNDPRWVGVQMQIRVPWWRREQLNDEARAAGVPLAQLLADAVDRVYPPEPPS